LPFAGDVEPSLREGRDQLLGRCVGVGLAGGTSSPASRPLTPSEQRTLTTPDSATSRTHRADAAAETASPVRRPIPAIRSARLTTPPR